MTNQLNFSNTKPAELEVHLNDLESKRIEVKNAGFELLEIWHTGDTQSHEIWQNSVTSESIKLQILTQPSEPVDASRQEVVDELVDLWIELRAIRDNFDSYFEDELSSLPKSTSLKEQFDTKVDQFKYEKELDPEGWAFLFNASLDESILAYYDLSIAERKAICH